MDTPSYLSGRDSHGRSSGGMAVLLADPVDLRVLYCHPAFQIEKGGGKAGKIFPGVQQLSGKDLVVYIIDPDPGSGSIIVSSSGSGF